MAILKIKDENGKFIDIPAIQGGPGPQGPIGPQGPEGPQGPAGEGGVSLEEVKAITGELDNLSTEDKSNLVNAINEVASNIGGNGTIYEMDLKDLGITDSTNYVSLTTSDKEIVSDVISKAYSDGVAYPTFLLKDKYGCMIILRSGANILNTPATWYFSGFYIDLVQVNNPEAGIKINAVSVSLLGAWESSKFACSFFQLDIERNQYLSYTNTIAYTPTSNYHPATKKYVDDTINEVNNTKTIGYYSIEIDAPVGYGIEYNGADTKEIFRDVLQKAYNSSNRNFVLSVGNKQEDTNRVYYTRNDIIEKPTYIGLIEFVNTRLNRFSDYDNGGQFLRNSQIAINCTWDGDNIIVSRIDFFQADIHFLSTTNEGEYTPTGNYNPATKKYVDDAIAALRAELTGGQ